MTTSACLRATVIGAALLAACSGGTTSTASPGGEPVVVDWVDDDSVTTLPGGWRVHSIDGDAPILAVERHGELVGAVEAAAYPVASLDGGRDLEAMAQSFYDTTRADRRQGCGYEIATADVREATVGRQPGIRYGFTGPAEGRPTERIIGYATVTGDHVVVVVASAHDADGCIGTDEVVFDTDTLADFAPVLARIVADMPLPLEVLDLSTTGGTEVEAVEGAHDTRAGLHAVHE